MGDLSFSVVTVGGFSQHMDLGRVYVTDPVAKYGAWFEPNQAGKALGGRKHTWSFCLVSLGLAQASRIGVGKPPRAAPPPPNRTGGFPASGSPVDS
jgi:hypothetical protein